MLRTSLLVLVVGFVCLQRVQGQQRVDSAKSPRTYTLGETIVQGTVTPSATRLRRIESTERLSAKEMGQLASPTLSEQFNRVAGMRLQPTCGVCGAAELRLNGLEGPYTLVMVDSAPLVGSLAGIYGTQGLPTLMARAVDVTRGLPTANLPSEAMGGAINILSRPVGGVLPQMRLLSGSFGETSLDVAVPLHTRWALFGQLAARPSAPDKNKDGYYDLVKFKRSSVALTGQQHWGNIGAATVYVRGYTEHRVGGQIDFRPADHRLKDKVYGEDIVVYRGEGVSRMRWSGAGAVRQHSLASAAWHYQNAAYGTTPYVGSQTDLFLQHSFSYRLGQRVVAEAGPTLRYLGYNDNSPITPQARHELTAGIYAQAEVTLGRILVRPGLRVDRTPTHGIQYSPRVHGLWTVGQGFRVRMGSGLAYRTVNVITEDHAALTGSRRLVLPAVLKPEQALTSLAELTLDTTLGTWHIETAFTTWRTDFSSKIIADLETDPNAIIYRNTGEWARNEGITVQALAKKGGFSSRASGTLLRYQRRPEGEAARSVIYTPSWQAQGELSWNFTRLRLQATSRIEAVGPIPLPLQQNDVRPATSKPFFLLQAQLSYQPTKRVMLLANVRNITNWQPKYGPLNRPQDPFDTQATPQTGSFDTAYIYGPLGGRTFLLGVDYFL